MALLFAIQFHMSMPYQRAYIEAIINEAVVEAENQGIKGKDATPFLLGKL